MQSKIFIILSKSPGMKFTAPKGMLGAAGLSVILIASFLVTNSGYATPSDLLPDLRPDMKSLTDHDLVKDPRTGQILLRFGGTLDNVGDGKLDVIGTRTVVNLNDNTMPAFQRIYNTAGGYHDVQVGTLIYHPQHHHFHFSDAMLYELKDNNNNVVATSVKQSFCLADSTIADPTLQYFSKVPVFNRCYHDARAKFVEMGISVGWSDVYPKDLVGQSIDVTNLMQQPQKVYILQETSNPDGILIEKNTTPQKISIPITLGLGIPYGVGISRPGV